MLRLQLLRMAVEGRSGDITIQVNGGRVICIRPPAQSYYFDPAPLANAAITPIMQTTLDRVEEILAELAVNHADTRLIVRVSEGNPDPDITWEPTLVPEDAPPRQLPKARRPPLHLVPPDAPIRGAAS